MFNKREFDSGIYNQKNANKWLKHGDSINIGEITLKVLETPGHSPNICWSYGQYKCWGRKKNEYV